MGSLYGMTTRMQRWSMAAGLTCITMKHILTTTISIVLIHGLRGDRVSTWTKGQVTWPRDFLSKDVEKSRIISFGYDSGVVHSDTAEVTQGSLESDARSLCSLLNAERTKDGTVRHNRMNRRSGYLILYADRTTDNYDCTQPWRSCLCSGHCVGRQSRSRARYRRYCPPHQRDDLSRDAIRRLP